MDIKEIEAELRIDKHDLDTELMSQADLFYRVAQEYAHITSIKDELYENIKQTDAKTNIMLRESFADRGTKVTESQINAAVLDHRDHKEAFHDWITSKEEADKLGSLKEAFMQRSYMLKDLAQLYIAGYWADKTVSAEDATSKEAVYEKRKRRMAERRREKSNNGA